MLRPDAFAEELARCRFDPPGTEVVCAVSGGADSSALLILAVAAGCSVEVIHVDHGLRDGSAAEVDTVAALCSSLGVAFTARSVQLEPGPNLEARARHARYEVLPAGVLTGHTADDQAETMLINLMRGAGLDGMAGIARTTRRPLLGLRRSDTEAVCARAGVVPIIDVMNADPAYLRVRVRHELLPLLDDLSGRDVAGILARQAALFADDAQMLNDLAGEIDVEDARAVAGERPALARRAIRRFLQVGPGASHPVDARTVERVLDVAAGLAVSTDVGQGWRVHRTDQRLRLVPPKA